MVLLFLLPGCARIQGIIEPDRQGSPGGEEATNAGCKTTEFYDLQVDGVMESIRTASYDAHGNIEEVDITADVSSERTQASYVYSRDGLLIRSDLHEEGTHTVGNFEYDHGRLTRFVSHNGNDGTPSAEVLLAYDQLGRRTLIWEDHDTDGEAEVITTLVYEGDQVFSHVETRRGQERQTSVFDGDKEIRREWHDGANLIRQADTDLDRWGKRTQQRRTRLNPNGIEDITVITYHYDQGRLTGSDIDVANNGVIEAVTAISYECD